MGSRDFTDFKHDPRSSEEVHGTLIKSLAVLQCLSVKLIKYKEQEIEIKEVLSALMDQHRFPYANTCEDLFFKWSEYERNNPLQ
jgi:hypothetical protein